jgi:hypothetical protein
LFLNKVSYFVENLQCVNLIYSIFYAYICKLLTDEL